ncbi:hypothetical protein QQF64_017094 [Cirrhinus molitorella]|uniref:Uncharacterized protein n=1 Tax=Cirrhinus molitorella TaxID=172907 RepID=A0ABR3LK74_9TELE
MSHGAKCMNILSSENFSDPSLSEALLRDASASALSKPSAPLAVVSAACAREQTLDVLEQSCCRSCQRKAETLMRPRACITLLTVPRRKKKCIRYLQRGRCASPHSSDGSAIDSPPSPVYHPPNPASPPASPASSPLPQSGKRSAHPPRLSLDFSRIKTEGAVRQLQ